MRIKKYLALVRTGADASLRAGTDDGSSPARRVVGGISGAGGPVDGDTRIFSIAIVGRPNVGKSTLFNRLIGEERSVVHDMPGTTRDTIDTVVETEVGPIRFLDTAGMRRRSRIDEDTEYYSVVRALKSVDSADVALLVVVQRLIVDSAEPSVLNTPLLVNIRQPQADEGQFTSEKLAARPEAGRH